MLRTKKSTEIHELCNCCNEVEYLCRTIYIAMRKKTVANERRLLLIVSLMSHIFNLVMRDSLWKKLVAKDSSAMRTCSNHWNKSCYHHNQNGLKRAIQIKKSPVPMFCTKAFISYDVIIILGLRSKLNILD